MDAGAVELRKTLMPLAGSLTDCIANISHMALSSDIQVTVEDGARCFTMPRPAEPHEHALSVDDATSRLIAGGSMLKIDQRRIMYVVRHFINNAFRVTQRGGHIRITSSHVKMDSKLPPAAEHDYDQDGSLIIKVADDGAGIPLDQQAKLFQQFSEYDASELYGGRDWGMGLWICQTIAEQHKGQVGLTSDGVDQGSVFLLEIPTYHATSTSNTFPAPMETAPSTYRQQPDTSSFLSTR